jgi:hypothetical protein
MEDLMRAADEEENYFAGCGSGRNPTRVIVHSELFL